MRLFAKQPIRLWGVGLALLVASVLSQGVVLCSAQGEAVSHVELFHASAHCADEHQSSTPVEEEHGCDQPVCDDNPVDLLQTRVEFQSDELPERSLAVASELIAATWDDISTSEASHVGDVSQDSMLGRRVLRQTVRLNI